MTRVAFVVQRCGLEVNGGSEKSCLDVAARLVDRLDVEILTTCALDYRTWADHYEPGCTLVSGVPVRRFRVAEPRARDFDRLSEAIRAELPHAGIAASERWMRAQGPWSPDLFAWIAAHREHYDAFFFFTYLYATTYFGLPEAAPRAFLVPTAHEEWPLHLPIWDRLFALPRGFVFLTVEERETLRRRFPSLALPGPVAGVGVDAPAAFDPDSFRRRYGIAGPYLLYVGRIEPSKGCDRMLEYYERWRAGRPDAPPLVLLGRAFMDVPETPGIVQTGFVDDQTKWDALAGCACLVMPSPYESLSIALLEAWHAGRPVLVNGACDVLVGQTQRAQGGLWFGDAASFGAALDRILGDPAHAALLGRQGRAFVDREVRWDRITDCYVELAESVAASASGATLVSSRANGGIGGRTELVPGPAIGRSAEPPGGNMEPSQGSSAAPPSAGLSRAEQHLAPPAIRSTSRLGFLGVYLRRLVARLTRFQTAHQSEFNQGVVTALHGVDASLRAISAHLGSVSQTLEAVVGQSLPSIGADIGRVSATVEKVVGEALPTLGTGLSSVSQTVAQLVGESVPALGNQLGAVSQTVEQIVGDSLPALGSSLSEVSQTVEKLVGESMPALGAGLSEVSQTVEKLVGESMPELGTQVGAVSRTVEQIVDDSLPALGAGLSEVSHTVEKLVGESMPELGAQVGAVSRTVEQIVGDSLPALGAGLSEVSQTVEKLVGETMPALGDHLGEVSRTVDGLATQTAPALEDELRRHGDHMAVVSRSVEQLVTSHGEIHETQRAQGRHLDVVATDVADLDERVGTRLDEAEGSAQIFEEQLGTEVEKLAAAVADLEHRFRPNLHFDQFDFARQYRGSEEELTRRLAKYAVLFGPVQRVLDVGCGRGEFLQACREAGIGAYGIEADPEMVSRCTMKALEVVAGDAIAHLRSLPDRSLDGIFSAQVVEHLTNSEIVEFVHLAADKLKRGAVIVIETINPDTFSALRWFWMDPTHRQPVSAATLRFLLEETGFTLRDVLYSSPVPEQEALARLPEAGAASAGGEALLEVARAYNRNVEKLNRVLFGDQDYAVIAER